MVESICSLQAICSGSSLNSQVVRDSRVNGREQPDSTVRSEERQATVPTIIKYRDREINFMYAYT